MCQSKFIGQKFQDEMRIGNKKQYETLQRVSLPRNLSVSFLVVSIHLLLQVNLKQWLLRTLNEVVV